MGSIPESERSPGEGNGTHSSILAWRIPLTEEPGGLQSWGHEESDMTERLSTYTYTHSKNTAEPCNDHLSPHNELLHFPHLTEVVQTVKHLPTM